MMKLPVPAPTNQSNTCLFCGKKLPNENYNSYKGVSLSDATEVQLQVWPLIHWYTQDQITGERTYLRSTYKSWATFFHEGGPRGLSCHNGSLRRQTQQGDNCFCTKVCAIQFARVAANMGFRLPSHTPDERKQAQQHAAFLQEFAPYELEPTPLPAIDLTTPGWKCRTRSATENVRNWTDFTTMRAYTGPRQPTKSKRVLKPER